PSRTGVDQGPLNILAASSTTNFGMFPPTAIMDPDWESAIDAINDVCNLKKINCKFVIAPIAGRALYGYYYFGQAQVIARLMRKLASTGAEVHDFLWLNRFTAEALGSGVNYWEDPVHHSVDVGNFVLDWMAGRKVAAPEP